MSKNAPFSIPVLRIFCLNKLFISMGYKPEEIKIDLNDLTITVKQNGKEVISEVVDNKNLTLAKKEQYWKDIEKYWERNKPTEKIELNEEEKNIEGKKRAKLAKLYKWMKTEDERVKFLRQMEFGKEPHTIAKIIPEREQAYH